MTDTEHELAAALRLEEQLLPARTLSRIAAARSAALAAPAPSWVARWLKPMMGAAVLASALGIAVLMPQQAETPYVNTRPEADAPELYRDLDFYLWLAESDMGRHG